MLEKKPDFERFRTALLGQEPDRVPLAELKMDQDIKEAFLGKPVRDLKTEVEFWHRASYDYIRFRPEYDFQYVASTKFTSKYSLYKDEEERNWAPEKKGLITSEEEFEDYPWVEPEEINYSKLQEVSKYLPEGMKLVSGVTGIFESVWMLMGFETFSLSTIENPRLVRKMFDKLGALHLGIFKTAISFESIGAMWVSDDIAYIGGLMVSPELLREHLFPWYKKMGRICRRHDLPYLFHSDGNLWEVLDDLIDLGFNALHPIEPKAMNINDLKEKVGDKICLIGNIDLSYTLTRGTPREVVAETRQRIKDLAPGGGYCLGSSNTVTSYVRLENYKAMIDTTLKFGQYPVETSKGEEEK